MLIPFLIFSLAAIGLNLLTGYAGLLSLGTGGFMGVGAYACLKLTTSSRNVEHHRLDPRVGFLLRRGRCAVWPAVAAHQGFLSRGGDAGRAILPGMVLHPHSLALQLQRLGSDRSAAADACMGIPITGPTATSLTRYLVVLSIVVVMTWIASNLVHGRIGRMWMSVRDMDLAAELIGIRLLARQAARLCGLLVLLRRRRRDDGVPMVRRRGSRMCLPSTRAFSILFMVIIGGLGNLIGSFFGAALIYMLPIALRAIPDSASACRSTQPTAEQLTFVIVGALIIAVSGDWSPMGWRGFGRSENRS